MTVTEQLHLHHELAMICAPDQDYIWRVEIHDTGLTEVRYIGFCPVDDSGVTMYDDLSDIPEWMQHRVAALHMMPANPNDSSIYGIGRRIDEGVYWVVQ